MGFSICSQCGDMTSPTDTDHGSSTTCPSCQSHSSTSSSIPQVKKKGRKRIIDSSTENETILLPAFHRKRVHALNEEIPGLGSLVAEFGSFHMRVHAYPQFKCKACKGPVYTGEIDAICTHLLSECTCRSSFDVDALALLDRKCQAYRWRNTRPVRNDGLVLATTLFMMETGLDRKNKQVVSTLQDLISQCLSEAKQECWLVRDVKKKKMDDDE